MKDYDWSNAVVSRGSRGLRNSQIHRRSNKRSPLDSVLGKIKLVSTTNS